MRAWRAFTKKEFLEAARTGKLLLLGLIFLLLGVMNPALAKLTPWLIESMADSMKETGLSVTAVTVNALSSWTQFYKNAPMALIAFALLFGAGLAGEYERGTLVNMLTKGLARWKVLTAKAAALLIFWSGSYWLMFGVTWGYTVYFWDGGEITHTALGAACVYLLGIWMISLLLLGFGVCRFGGALLGVAGGGFALSYLLSMLPALRNYLPTQLLAGLSLMSGGAAPKDFAAAVAVTAALSAVNMCIAALCFNRRAVG